jgi:signal transduction histidine kinase
MVTVSTLFLLDLGTIMRFDILAWVIGIPIVALALVLLFVQKRQAHSLKADLAQLEKIKRHTIEYELVLKALRLCIWRLDIPTLTVTFETDYRDSTDTVVFPPACSVETVFNMMLPIYATQLRRAVDDVIAGRIDECHLQYQIRILHSDETYWGELYATVDKRDQTGKPLTLVGTSQRIDKQKEIESALIEARNHAEESDRLKSAFLANISHEVRTPLNAIVGFSEVLPMAQSAEEREQLIDLIRQNNAHLLRLFDDMVHMSKLESGGDAVKKRYFELKPMFEEIIGRYSKQLDSSRVQLALQPSSADLQPFTDRERLFEIVSQYVDNAVKSTSDGSITLGYELHGKTLRVWVRDTGKGIPEELCNDWLFDRFVKVDEFVPGTGLGLSICRSMAKSLGGRVGFESKLGEGSLFWAEVPFD